MNMVRIRNSSLQALNRGNAADTLLRRGINVGQIDKDRMREDHLHRNPVPAGLALEDRFHLAADLELKCFFSGGRGNVAGECRRPQRRPL